MKTILNVIWLVLCGFWMFLSYMVAGLVLCITIIGIPFGLAAFRIGVYALWPFGYTVVERRDAGAPSCVGNVLWLVLAGFGGWRSAISSQASSCASRSSASRWASPTSS